MFDITEMIKAYKNQTTKGCRYEKQRLVMLIFWYSEIEFMGWGLKYIWANVNEFFAPIKNVSSSPIQSDFSKYYQGQSSGHYTGD